jgi:hypothetical protein
MAKEESAAWMVPFPHIARQTERTVTEGIGYQKARCHLID